MAGDQMGRRHLSRDCASRRHRACLRQNRRRSDRGVGRTRGESAKRMGQTAGMRSALVPDGCLVGGHRVECRPGADWHACCLRLNAPDGALGCQLTADGGQGRHLRPSMGSSMDRVGRGAGCSDAVRGCRLIHCLAPIDRGQRYLGRRSLWSVQWDSPRVRSLRRHRLLVDGHR